MIPAKFRIAHDNYHARYVGVTRQGQQFFVTTPFVPAFRCEGRNFVATYLFDREGSLVEDRIEELGARVDGRAPPGNVDMRLAEKTIKAHLEALDVLEFCDIDVAPFEIERYGIRFGLIPLPADEEVSDYIELHPGNYMAFYEPWDGRYDT